MTEASNLEHASPEERALAVTTKAKEFLGLIDALRTPPMPAGEVGGVPLYAGTFDRELIIAAERIEEAALWACKHIFSSASGSSPNC